MNIDLGGNTLTRGYFAGILDGQNASTQVAFIDKSGSDETGGIGNATTPFLTAQAAYEAVYAAYLADESAYYVLKFGVGSWAGINITTGNPPNIIFSGAGATVSNMGGFTAIAPDGAGGAGDSGANGENGTDIDVTLISDGTLNFGSININAGNGGGGAYNSGGVGGLGGAGGAASVSCIQIVAESIGINGAEGTEYGGGGGNGGYDDIYVGGNGGNGGNATLIMTECDVSR